MATIEQIKQLLLDNNTVIQQLPAMILLESLVESLSLTPPSIPTPPSPPTSTRSRTVTPVSDEERCTQTLVSGKKKGSQCSKKSTVGSLCTIHFKKLPVTLDTLPVTIDAL
jgi:hypothetical protein